MKLGKKLHEVNLAPLAAVVLLLFNDNDQMTFETIKEKTDMPEDELKRILQSLACAKIKVLTKSPKSREINSGDKFEVNSSFAHPSFKFKLPLVATRNQEKVESDKTRHRVEDERRDITDAAIVRVMKSRKQMSHNDLVVEVTQHLSRRFAPNPLYIKRRIEVLIEREYLQRSEADRRIYNYCA